MNFNDSLIGEDNAFLAAIEQTSKAASLTKPVLIIGERGTGKELIAQRLHYLSKRWQGPFITLNCAALSEQLLDSELFGHEAGAFTGAQKRHQGRFERADGGTLFLDELGNAPMLVQEKLLRVIEYGQLERVGGSQQLKFNVRLVCATNEDLPKQAKLGYFRADLLDRLAFDVIHLPPLRERRSDILLLANHFAIAMCRELSWSFFPGLTQNAINELLGYDWPGNIRELKNAIERSIYRHENQASPIDNIIIDPFKPLKTSVIREFEASTNLDQPNLEPTTTLHESNVICESKHQSSIPNIYEKNTERPKQLPINLKDHLEKIRSEYVELALQTAKYHHKEAAQLLGLTYDQFRTIIRKKI
ncbi:phage shock protein operon transcriptional activator [Thorsellia anophelis]|uniref:Psp operon transcriptional activator n=1 Tax=Thorsellia anophelis DSM 18579 TaxID=1123402 RepID=A0A1I0AQ66_9GAMM|nr:phage shock protein operon transcriptional activator [Thorsellia anophelis]SES96055.1 psp operon transcriptional activator [Thorsellia anophelis DSM 18579]